MCVCKCVYTCVCTFVCVHVCTCVRVHVSTWLPTTLAPMQTYGFLKSLLYALLVCVSANEGYQEISAARFAIDTGFY